MMRDGIGWRGEWGWGGWGVIDSYQGVGMGAGGGYYLIVFLVFFYLCFLPFVLSCPVSWFK